MGIRHNFTAGESDLIPWDFCNMIGGILMILSINAHNFHVISFSSLPQILR